MRADVGFIIVLSLWCWFQPSRCEGQDSPDDSPITVADDSTTGTSAAPRTVTNNECTFQAAGKHAVRIDVYDSAKKVQETYMVIASNGSGKTWSITTSDGKVTVEPNNDMIKIKSASGGIMTVGNNGCKVMGDFMHTTRPAVLTIGGHKHEILYSGGRMCIHYCKTNSCGGNFNTACPGL